MPEPTTGRRYVRLLPLAVLVAGFVAFFALGLDHYISLEVLRAHHHTLAAWVAAHGALAMLTYVGLYAAVTAFSLPIASLVTIVGGYLFGWVLGGGLTIVGATAGAVVVFLAARAGLRPEVRARTRGAIQRMEAGFRRNAFSYLLFLRLVPVFPFWLVNLVPALLGVRLGTYLGATLIGIAPGSFVYASAGSGLGRLLEEGGEPDLAMILEPEYLLPILGLAILALGPVAFRRWRARRARGGPGAEETDAG